LVALVLPFPRTATPARARLDVESVPGGRAMVRLQLEPSDAASNARWFETIAWQGGGLRLVPMVQTGPGAYATEAPVPVSGDWKTLVRLHRRSDLMAVPVYMPRDPDIGAREVPLGDRTVPFTRDTALLMRESKGGPPIVARVIYAALLLTVALWMALMIFAAMKGGPAGREPRMQLSAGRRWARRATARSGLPSA
jgi:hypothetical protein